MIPKNTAMKLLKKIKKLFSNKKEYLYLFNLPTRSFDDKTQQKEIKLRTEILDFIQKDLRKSRKKIRYSDILVDAGALNTYFIFVTENIATNILFRPLFYEIYEYTKKGDKVFTYPLKKLIYKNTETELSILKFTVKC